jgi:hypothetical protein
MSINAKDAARRIILSHTDDVEFLTISEMTQDEAEDESLTDAQHDQLCSEIADLIGKASVTVTFPGDPVCTGCGGTGQPGEDDGTPKDLPQWENLRALLDDQWAGDGTGDELADAIMVLFGGEAK